MPNQLPIDIAKVEYFTTLAERVQQVRGKGRGKIIEAAAAFKGVSKKTIYQWLKLYGGYQADRKRRADAGSTRVTKDGQEFVSRAMFDSKRLNGKQTMPATVAVEAGVALGYLEDGTTVENVRRVLRQRRLMPDQLNQAPPHVNLRSLHPNHVWEFDVSTCVIYYMKGRLHELDPSSQYKNKPDNVVEIKNHRVQRYVITDHCSGSIFCRYYLTPGESSAVLFEFLMEAFAKRDGFVMHGVPLVMLWDKGSANTSTEIKNVLDALDVKYIEHSAGNARAKGQVENAHNLIETQFESRLRFTRIDRGIEQLNQLVDVWQKDFNATRIHSRMKCSRWETWQTIRREQLRIAPDAALCRSYMNGVTATRVVHSNRTIKYAIPGKGSLEYSLAETPVCVGEKVRVIPNAFLYPDIVIEFANEFDKPVRYQIPPIEIGQYGFPVNAVVIDDHYRSMADTRIETEQKARDQALYGTAEKRAAEKLKLSGVPAYGGKLDVFTYLEERPQPDFMQRAGTELHLPHTSKPVLKPLNHIQALKEIHHRLNRKLTAEENQLVRTSFPDGVPEEAIVGLVEQFRRRAESSPLTAIGGS